jgi:hypothetical protein
MSGDRFEGPTLIGLHPLPPGGDRIVSELHELILRRSAEPPRGFNVIPFPSARARRQGNPSGAPGSDAAGSGCVVAFIDAPKRPVVR